MQKFKKKSQKLDIEVKGMSQKKNDIQKKENTTKKSQKILLKTKKIQKSDKKMILKV